MEKLPLSAARVYGLHAVKLYNEMVDKVQAALAGYTPPDEGEGPVDPEDPEDPDLPEEPVGTVYTLASRPSVFSVDEGTEITVSNLPVGNKQKAINGNWVSMNKPVILDTDWWTDSDDAVAMRIFIHQERLKMIKILGVAHDTNLAKGPGSLEAFFIADGRDNVEYATPKTPHVPDGSPSYQARLFEMPHKVGAPETLENAVSFYRRILSQSTEKIDIIAIGYMNNLSELLNSPADQFSPLTGKELVAQKVNMLWAMAGRWPTGGENNFTRTSQSRQAGATLCKDWPTKIVFLGFEIANNVISGGNLASSDESGGYLHMALTDHGFPNGRASWDPMTVLLATVGNTAVNGVDLTPNGFRVVRGTATVDPANGQNSWVDSPTGNHYYVVKTQSDAKFVSNMNSYLIKSKQTQTVPIIAGIDPDAPIVEPVITDEANLVEEWNAKTIQEPVGTKVASWTGKKGTVATQDTAQFQPTSAQASDGTKTVLFSDNVLFTPNMQQTVDTTVYAMIRWDTSYNQITQSFVSVDTGAGMRNWHLKTNADKVTAATFNGDSGATDVYTNSSILQSGRWYVIAFSRNATTITAYLDGVSDGTSNHTGANVNSVPLAIGCRGIRNEWVKAGMIKSIRVYKSAHDAATVDKVTKEMLV